MKKKLITLFSASKVTPVLFFLLLTTLLIISWFRKGLLYGGGDIGLPIYDPKVLVQVSKYTWWPNQGTGFSYPATLSAYPFYLLFALMQNIGFSALVLQIFFFFMILFFAFTGAFYFIRSISDDTKVAYIASIFYVFNSYAMMNVFHRFAHTGIIMFAFIPWTAFLIYKGVKDNNLNFALILGLTSLITSYAFGTPAFLAMWWFFVLAFWLYASASYLKNGKHRIRPIIFIVIVILLWIGLNLRWLLPFINTASQALSTTTSPSGNVDSLRGVSRYFSIPYAIRGINSFFLTDQKDWGNYFINPYIDFISFSAFSLVFVVIFSKKKPRLYKFFLPFYLLVIFISKGSEMPLGQLMVTAFSSLPVLGVFRNPFEKFGILLPLSIAYFTSFGFIYLLKSGVKIIWKALCIILVVIYIFVYHWPIWSGNIFGGLGNSALVRVPTSYSQASKWIQEHGGEHRRTLHLPLALGDGIQYKWNWGYNGLEPSALFFPGSSVSHLIGFDVVDDRFREIASAIKQRDKNLFSYLLTKFGISFIVLHNDVSSYYFLGDSTDEIGNFLNSFKSTDNGLVIINAEQIYDSLAIYTVNSLEDPVFYIDPHPSIISGDLRYFDTHLFKDITISSAFINDAGDIHSDFLLPDLVINYPKSTVNIENVIGELPYARILPGNILNPLIRLKEYFSLLPQSENEKLLTKLNYSSKRLVEAYRLVGEEDSSMALKTLLEYKKAIIDLTPSLYANIRNADNSYDYKSLQYYQAILFRQKDALQFYILPLLEGNKTASEISQYQKDLITKLGIDTIYPIDGINYPSPTFRFSVHDPGSYYLSLSTNEWSNFLVDPDQQIYVDGKKNTTKISRSAGVIKLGPLSLDAGVHEIAISIKSEDITNEAEIITSPNVSGNTSSDAETKWENIQIISVKDEGFLTRRYKNINPNFLYMVNFEYWVKSGESPRMSIIQDVDPIKDGIKVPVFDKLTSLAGYNLYWKDFFTYFKPSSVTRNLDFKVSLEPWGPCFIDNSPKECGDKNYIKLNSKTSHVEIRNFTITRIPNGGVYLETSSFDKTSKPIDSSLTYSRENPTRYTINLSQSTSGLLVFKETYHPDWVLEDSNGNKVKAQHVIADGYANGWIVEDLEHGLYQVQFGPEKRKRIGEIYGTILIIIGIGVFLKYKNERYQ